METEARHNAPDPVMMPGCSSPIGGAVCDALVLSRLTARAHGWRVAANQNNIYATRYTYDNMNQVSSVTYPSGMTVNYQRDQRSRVTDISLSHSSLSGAQSILSGIQYRADNLPVAQTLGNGLQETLTYDLQGRLQTQQLGALFDRTYHYDANGNVLGIDTLNTNLGYGYDALDRINSETGILESLLTYDGNSNRLTQTLTGQTDYDYKVNSNQLVKVGDTDLTLDAAGNTLTDGIKQFSYNDRNQMESYGESGSTVASYEYDVANLRTRKTTSTSNHLYHYDLIGRRIQQDVNGQNRTATVWLGWQPVAQVQFSGSSIDSITYLTGDQIGSPRLGTDDSQNIIWRWDSDAFGSVEPATDPDGDGAHINVENRFVGQYADGESGLRYNWHRYYDAGKGRYVSSDPIGLAGGLNTYAYVGGNSLSFVDIDGLCRGPTRGLCNAAVAAAGRAL